MTDEKHQSQQRELVVAEGVTYWLYPDGSHRAINGADAAFINSAIAAHEAARTSAVDPNSGMEIPVRGSGSARFMAAPIADPPVISAEGMDSAVPGCAEWSHVDKQMAADTNVSWEYPAGGGGPLLSMAAPNNDQPDEKPKYRAEFLWKAEEGSVEEAGYEFVNAGTEEYRKEMWDVLLQRATKRDSGKDKELLDEADSLLYIARHAARKLKTMYIRGEVSPRSELDALIDATERFVAWVYKKRDIDYDPPANETESEKA